MPCLEKKAKSRKYLVDKGYGPQLDYFSAEEDVVEHQRNWKCNKAAWLKPRPRSPHSKGGKGLLPGVGAETANKHPMRKIVSPPKPSGSAAAFVVPDGAQSGNITLTPGKRCLGGKPVRTDDRNGRPRFKRGRSRIKCGAAYDKFRGRISARGMQREHTVGNKNGLTTRSRGVGRCPVGVDVDRSNLRHIRLTMTVTVYRSSTYAIRPIPNGSRILIPVRRTRSY
jgi:hypothetical protein